MANNEIKTNAEIYREQRKARLAKAAKKKKSSKGDKIVGIIIKAICVLLALALILYFVSQLLLNVFCVPQKLLTAATYGDEKITVAEYNYFYSRIYNQAVQVSQYYEQQQAGSGAQYFDTTVDPTEQKYTNEDAPEGVETWADYFRVMAHETAFQYKKIYKDATSEEAKKAGFKITKEQQKEMDTSIEETMTTIEDKAAQDDFSVDNYIARTQAEGLNAKSFKEILVMEHTVQYYLTWFQENAANDITEEDVNNHYEANKGSFDHAAIRFFTVSYAEAEEGAEGAVDPVYTKKEAKAIAEQFAAEVFDVASFKAAAEKHALPSLAEQYKEDSATFADGLTKDNLSTLSEKLADWVFNEKRAVNDVSVFDVADQESYYIVMIEETASRDTATAGADVRHLLVEAKAADEEGNALSEDKIAENKANAKAEAEKLLAEWKAGKATEDTFAKLVTKHTDDTASAETGGLYEDINSESSYVPEFLAWALADHKKGDVEIVETEYGYHIMYYVGADKMQKWESDVRAEIANTSYIEYEENLVEDVSEKAVRNEKITDFFAKRNEERISSSIAYAAANSTLSY